MLLELIRVKRLAGSQRNKITVVFDGYPNPGGIFGSFENKEGPDVIFSRKETADERIKNMVQHYPKTRDVIVVSDDKEIKFFIASCGAKAMGVEEFFGMSKEKLRRKEEQEEALKPEITYSQMREINEELKKIWQISS